MHAVQRVDVGRSYVPERVHGGLRCILVPFRKVGVVTTGYIQRQLIKSMEDLTVQHDGTVRDANHNIIQYHYGEDGINPTKIEIQNYSIGKLSKEEIEKLFGMEGVDWSTILKDGIIREADAELLTEYKEQLAYDKRMMVEGVFQSKALDSDAVFAPVNLARWILNVKNRFALHPTERTDLTPSYVLQGIKTIIARTHRHHKIWAGLLRFHLAPHKLIIKERFTKAAFDMLVELIVVAHMKAWVQPGDQVGIVAAQSIGEPATQMSNIGSTVICITNGSDVKYRGTVKDFMDPILKANAANIKTIGKNSVVLPMEEGEDYYIMGVSEDEKTSWHRISEMSRHPCHGGIVEVKTRTGRTTTATLSHSFLKRSPSGIVPVRGSDLKVGMRIPIARVIPEVPGATTAIKCGETTFELTREFGWICGIYLADGSFNGNNVIITKQAMVVETNLAAFSKLHGITNSVRHYDSEYGPSKSIMIPFKDLKDCLMATFGTGSYQKFVGANVFHANKEFIAGVIAGFFDGDGNVNAERQMIRAGSRCQTLIKDITALLGYVGMYATMSEETSIRIPDKVLYTMVIPSKFAKEYKEKLGFQLPEKAKALDEIIAYNARADAKCKQDAIDQIPEVGDIIAETGKILQFPDQSRTYGRWKKKEAIGRQTLAKYVGNFEARIQEFTTQGIAIHPRVAPNMELLRSAVDADVIWDEIVELTEYDDPNEFVYDFTVPGNDSFMVDCNVLVHNTLNKVLLRTGDCLIGCCIAYQGKQCKYSHGLQTIYVYNHLVSRANARDARPSNSGDPLKLMTTNRLLKRRRGRGERPHGDRNNVMRCEPQGKQWAILSQVLRRRILKRMRGYACCATSRCGSVQALYSARA